MCWHVPSQIVEGKMCVISLNKIFTYGGAVNSILKFLLKIFMMQQRHENVRHNGKIRFCSRVNVIEPAKRSSVHGNTSLSLIDHSYSNRQRLSQTILW